MVTARRQAIRRAGQRPPRRQPAPRNPVALEHRSGLRRQQVRRGHVVAAPGSLSAHRRFAASVYLLPAAEGGRRTEIHTGYRPQFYVRTTDVVGVLDLGPRGAAVPGDRVDATIEPGRPVALDTGLGFAIREGGRTVGAGTVTALLD
jgi:elongation factor Tu